MLTWLDEEGGPRDEGSTSTSTLTLFLTLTLALTLTATLTLGGEALRAELAALPRKELQARAKAAGLKANAKSLLLVEQLLALAQTADG